MKHETTETRLSYVNRLRSLRVHELGRGYYSHVFEHTVYPNIAVKVFDSEDKAYMRFAHWAERYLLNPFVPNIEKVVSYTHPKGDYALVFMEKLEPISRGELQNFWEEIGFPGGITSSNIHHARDVVHNDDLRVLLHFLGTRPKTLDLHEKNFMLRGHQVVFTDPMVA